MEYARSRGLLPSHLSSREQREAMTAALRRRSLFSARTTNAGILQDIGDGLDRLLSGETNEAAVRAWVQDRYDELGYTPEQGFPGDEGKLIPPAERGSLRDLSSDRRVKLMLETNLRQAANHAYREQGMDELARWQFPCWELVRIYTRKEERSNWEERWVRAGGQLFVGRMIARKDDAVWEQLGSSDLFDDGLDNPYPPFAFNSGMGVREVAREECVALGVIEADEQPEFQDAELNEELRVNAEQFTPELLEALRADLGEEIRALNNCDDPARLVNRARRTLDLLCGLN